jgi:hypothetical protein
MLVFYTWSVRYVADSISMMASTEKISWMATKTPQEGGALYNSDNANGGGKDTKDAGRMVVSVDARGDGGAPAGWPSRGTVEFDNVWMKYLPSAPYALKGELLLPAVLVILVAALYTAWSCCCAVSNCMCSHMWHAWQPILQSSMGLF